MLWAALLLPPQPDGAPPPTEALHGLALWALQFTPRVALVDEAAVMEVEASVRLFGGKRALRDRVRHESTALGAGALAWASTSLGALALARAGIENGFKQPLAELLDGLPLSSLTATQPHRATLLQLGCQTLGQVRALPRGGISRRFDAALLAALDQAYGLRPPSHAWLTVPETFRSRLELMSRAETAPEMLFGARRLLMQMCGWLAARQAGTTAFTLRWAHDTMRAREVGESGRLTVRTAEGTRNLEHLCRLLAEHLAKLALEAPVLELALTADGVRPLEVGSACLLPEPANKRESLHLLLERMAARLGPERVLRPVLVEDHRTEWMQRWQPASTCRAQGKAPGPPPSTVPMPQPTFVLATPLRLALRGPRPMFQGPLQLLAGPHRVEGGWWHRCKDEAGEKTHLVRRDYWVALSEHAGFLWVFQERLAEEEAGWYLHGSFA